MQSTHQAREPSHIGIQASGPLHTGSHLELQTQRDRLQLLRGLTGIKWTEGSRCHPATGRKRCWPRCAVVCQRFSGHCWTQRAPRSWHCGLCRRGEQPHSPHRSCLTSMQPRRVPGSRALVRVRPPQGLDRLPALLSTASASAVQLWAHAHRTTPHSPLGSLQPGRDLLLHAKLIHLPPGCPLSLHSLL